MSLSDVPPMVEHRICELNCEPCGMSREGHCSDLSESAWMHKETAHDGRDVTRVEPVKAILEIHDEDLVTDHDIGSKARELSRDFEVVEVKFR